MRIGFDIDGVLANFIKAYQTLVVEMSGEDRFKPGDIENPPCWNWPEFRGYDPELMDFKNGPVWARIKSDPDFWRTLEPMPAFEAFRNAYPWMRENHDVCFVTDRPGLHTKRQTEDWFANNGIWNPTVIVSADKTGAAKLLRLDAYIDDRFENAVSVATYSSMTTSCLLDRAYNRLTIEGVYGKQVLAEPELKLPTRVRSLEEFLYVFVDAPTSSGV